MNDLRLESNKKKLPEKIIHHKSDYQWPNKGNDEGQHMNKNDVRYIDPVRKVKKDSSLRKEEHRKHMKRR